MLASFLSAWNEFFHSRFSTKGSATGHPTTRTVAFIRYLRIAYGLCLLYDRLILSFDFRMFYLYPTTHPASSLHGAILPLFPCQQYLQPVRNTMTHSIVDVYLPYSPLCSIAEQLPISYHNFIYYLFHIVSIVNAILLICNVYPKLQLVLLHINMMSFHYHSLLIWDGEDVMFKLWNFLFLFLPLQSPPPSSSLTVPKSSTPTTSYPMWPIRLFQIELCCIYAGAGYAKLSTETWRSGNAMYHVIHEKDFFGGPYVPEFIFNKYGPLKLATWSSLFLECSCIFLVWSRNKYIKYGTVYSMIALHLGIESTMNMHVFEILSIIGWCMFLIQPDISYQDYKSMTVKTHSDLNRKTMTRYLLDIIQHTWVVNSFLLAITTILILDTFPLYEVHDVLNGVITVPLSSLLATISSPSKLSVVSGLVYAINHTQTKLLQLNELRRNYLFPYVTKYLYPIGLYQAVWSLYSGAPDMSCIFTTNITAYTIMPDSNSSNHQLNSYSYVSPDWGTMTWYAKKRYQRPMTMQEKLVDYMYRDGYVRYHANNIFNDVLSSEEVNMTNLHLASAALMVQCERPPPAPDIDDWFNWSGWFYADAKQDVLVQREPRLLYTTNICNDLNVELCQQYNNEGLCYIAQSHHSVRHRFDATNIDELKEKEALVYNITQTCRRSCNFCPEDGYDTNDLSIGTRISVYWPIPTWDNTDQKYYYDEKSLYYPGTIVQVRDYPLKQYRIKYDESGYNDEWFDPPTLRDRGYHFVPPLDNEIIGQSASTPDESLEAEVVETQENVDDDAVGADNDDDEVSSDDDDNVDSEESNEHGDEL